MYINIHTHPAKSGLCDKITIISMCMTDPRAHEIGRYMPMVIIGVLSIITANTFIFMNVYLNRTAASAVRGKSIRKCK